MDLGSASVVARIAGSHSQATSLVAQAASVLEAAGLFVCRNRRLEQYLYSIGIKPMRSEKEPDFMTAWIFQLTPRLLEAVTLYGEINERRRIVS